MNAQHCKVALVTGAGSGIGRAVSLGLAADGFELALLGLRAEPLQALAVEIGALGRRALVCIADVAEPQAVGAAFARIQERFGRLDLLFNNAGTSGTSGQLAAGTQITIVPKGLRSFDREDAGFFLELLPGPRDRDGLPESVRFWQTRIEETDLDRTFRIGLLYGPSGCGKS